MNYTPGPYTIEWHSHKIKIFSERGNLIATVNVFPEKPERSQANAHLLAAAPEMLASLKRLTELGGHFAKQAYLFDEALGAAWEAIAKAEGGK